MTWSNKAKRDLKARKDIRVEEACDAVIHVLREKGYTPQRNTYIKKRFLIQLAVKQVREHRKSNGIVEHEGIEIRPPSARFITNNWRDIRKLAEEAGIYIVWMRNGVKLGTLEQYRKNTNTLKDISQGVVEEVNERVDLTNKRLGIHDTFVEIRSKQESRDEDVMNFSI